MKKINMAEKKKEGELLCGYTYFFDSNIVTDLR